MHSDVEGRIVTALAGRDRGRSFVVTAAEPDGFVMLVDGDTRCFCRPKKKKLKHLQKTNKVSGISENSNFFKRFFLLLFCSILTESSKHENGQVCLYKPFIN